MKRNNKWAKAVARDLIAQGWQVDEAKKTFNYFGESFYRVVYFMEVFKNVENQN